AVERLLAGLRVRFGRREILGAAVRVVHCGPPLTPQPYPRPAPAKPRLPGRPAGHRSGDPPPAAGAARKEETMTTDLTGATVAFIAADGVEQVELTEPWDAVREAGGTPMLLAPASGSIRGFNHLTPADEFPVDALVAEVSADEIAGVVLPGGVANPD